MNTENSKLKITENEFNNKLVLCTGSALKTALISSILVAVGVPIACSQLKFLRTSLELRVAAGLFSSVAAGYYFAHAHRLNCLKNVEKNYTYYLDP